MAVQKEPFINEEAFIKAQEQGRRKLHMQLLLLMFFLCVFMMVGLLAVQTLFADNQIVVQYCVQAGMEMLLWFSLKQETGCDISTDKA